MMQGDQTIMSQQLNLSGFEQLFLALSDQTRLRLLSLMADGPASVGYLADQLGESQPKTSRHLAYLRNAGLVSTSREGKWVYYAIEMQADPAIQNVLRSTLHSISGNGTQPHEIHMGTPNNISAETHMSEWKPNELEVFLL
jgi:ArsR family transcriptional regulator, arsenate/arsenite/antimonite-responsive transcriptional repressor